MARWLIAGREEPFDDGETKMPGEDGFTTEIVAAEAAGADFNYVGTPNWTPPVVEEPAPEEPDA